MKGEAYLTAVTKELLRFAAETTFGDLPDEVVHEAKRSLLDSIGSAIAGMATEKGKIALHLARRLGGTPESSVIGTGDKVACATAAMVNGELMYALDFDTVPHISPFVLPPVLAMAESVRATGKEFLAAYVVGMEIARRMNAAMNILEAKVAKEAKTPDVFGNSNEHMLGASVGVAKILRLDPERMAHALGIAGYLCSLPVCRDWEDTMPKSMIKYTPAGWNCQAAVTAGLLAEQGYTGNPDMLDTPYGFHKFYGAGNWAPEVIVDGLGRHWRFTDAHYKPYPCCRFLQSAIDCFIEILESRGLKPEEIEDVKAYSLPFLAHPDQQNVTTQIDAQYSLPYALAVAAHRIPAGPAWQDMKLIQSPDIQAFMKKVSFIGDPRAGEEKKKDPLSWYARVEVTAGGKKYEHETLYSRGTNVDGFRLSDEDLLEKFKTNAGLILTQNKISRASQCIMEMESATDVSELIRHLV
jgi:2-methylcitrate dehydratase PrpD